MILQNILDYIKSQPGFILLVILIICIVAYCITIYHTNSKEKMLNGTLIMHMIQNTKYEMPDKRKIREMIELPNRNPAYLTSSMVAPVNVPSEEKKRETRMEVFNMFYNNTIDDEVSIHARPQNLFIIP
jgi:hypothetical protein